MCARADALEVIEAVFVGHGVHAGFEIDADAFDADAVGDLARPVLIGVASLFSDAANDRGLRAEQVFADRDRGAGDVGDRRARAVYGHCCVICLARLHACTDLHDISDRDGLARRNRAERVVERAAIIRDDRVRHTAQTAFVRSDAAGPCDIAKAFRRDVTQVDRHGIRAAVLKADCVANEVADIAFGCFSYL